MSKDLLEKLKLAGCRVDTMESMAAVMDILEEAIAEAAQPERDALQRFIDLDDNLIPNSTKWHDALDDALEAAQAVIRSRSMRSCLGARGFTGFD